MSTTATTSRIRSLVRRRYGQLRRGSERPPPPLAPSAPVSPSIGHPTGAYRPPGSFSDRRCSSRGRRPSTRVPGDTKVSSLGDAADGVDPDAPVGTVPDWSLRELVHHVGGIHRWATTTVREARTERYDTTLLEVVGAWPDDAELVDWFRAGHARSCRPCATRTRTSQCWSFFAAPLTLAFWARRQTHETAIHRADAQSCSGPVTPYARRARGGRRRRAPLRLRGPAGRATRTRPPRMRLRAPDVGREWSAATGPRARRRSSTATSPRPPRRTARSRPRRRTSTCCCGTGSPPTRSRSKVIRPRSASGATRCGSAGASDAGPVPGQLAARA